MPFGVFLRLDGRGALRKKNCGEWMMRKRIGLVLALMVTLIPLLSAGAMAGRWNGRAVRVAYAANSEPYQFEENGELKGIHVEIMREAAQHSGLDLVWKGYPLLSDCIAAVRTGEADVVLGVPLNRSSLGEGLAYSLEISASYMCMAVSRDVEKQVLSGGRYVGQAILEYDSLSYSMMSQYRGITSYIGVGSQRQVFEGLIQGTADIAFGVKSSLQYYLAQSGLTEEYPILYSYIQPVNYALLVDARSEELLEVLNQGISAVRSSQQYGKILDQWMTAQDPASKVSRWVEQNLSAFTFLLLGILCIFVISLAMNAWLRSMVAKQTAQLKTVNGQLRKNIAKAEYENDLRAQTIESHPNGILLFDEDGRIELSNRNAELMLDGGVSGELEGRNIREFPLMERLLGEWTICDFSRDTQGETVEVEISEESGVYYYQYSISTFVKPGDEEQQRRTAFMVIEDVTMRKLQSSQLLTIEKSRLLNQLVAGIAHEIRNPLASLKAFAQSAKDNAGDPEYLDAFENVVPGEVDRIDRLVSNLISYSKEPQTGANCGEVDLQRLVTSCIALIKVLAEKNRIVIQANVDGGLILHVSEDHLKQVILNMLINSIDAVREKQSSGISVVPPHIRIRGQRGDNGIVLEIRDEGCGMSQQTLKRATRPFYSTKSAGTGLGLAISERYIAECGGLMVIQSEEGKYTSIQISFPLR